MPTAAIPIDIASCWIDSSRPEAEPSSCGATPARITSNIGTNTMPMPKPVMASGPARSQAVTPPPAERITMSTTIRPMAMITIPMCIVVRPILASSADEVIEPPIAVTGIATVATAQASGLKPEAGLEHHVERDHHPAHRADEAEHDGQAGDVGAAA